MMPSYFQAEATAKKNLCSGVLANPALMPPGLHILSLTVLQWAELSFRPAGNEVSGYFSSACSPPYHHSSGDYVALAMRPLGCNSRPKVSISHHVQPHSNPPIPQGPSVNPCKIHPPPPHLPWYVSFFLTSIAPLFPILPALTVSVWVFCWVKNALALSHFQRPLSFAPFISVFLSNFSVWLCLMSSSCWVCLLTDRRLLACGLNVLLPQLKHSADGDNYYNYAHTNTPVSLNTLLSPSMLG